MDPHVEILDKNKDDYQRDLHSSKLRVAAYVRVSSNHDEQLISFENQREYFTNLITAHQDWELIEVYQDKGISGLATEKRDGFNRMLNDALSGRIDYIITKSISRFARNTVDMLDTVRKLQNAGVGVFFERENIYTLDGTGELMLSIFGSVAQEESRSTSENIKWGIQKKMAKGIVDMPYGVFLGYGRSRDGRPEIVEDEAQIVRRIYSLFLDGHTVSEIASILTAEQIPTPRQKNEWCPDTIRNILQNEKYMGDALLQKTYAIDFISKKRKTNNGEVTQYYVEQSHPAIIDESTFALAQAEYQQRKRMGAGKHANTRWDRKVICAECGGFCRRRLWKSAPMERTYAWRCPRCKGLYIRETQLDELLLKVAHKWKEDIDARDLECIMVWGNGKITLRSRAGKKATLNRRKGKRRRRHQ